MKEAWTVSTVLVNHTYNCENVTLLSKDSAERLASANYGSFLPRALGEAFLV